MLFNLSPAQILVRSHKCNDDCKIPDDIRVGLSWLPGYSYSPGKGVIRILKDVCGYLRTKKGQEHILHEVGHAVRDFSRTWYIIDRQIINPKGDKDSFWQKEEKAADDFMMSCDLIPILR